MALGDNYITMEELKDYMGLQDSVDDARIAAVCSAVSREVEDWTHRQFNQAASATARVYRPLGGDLVSVDDFFTTSGLIVQSDDTGNGTFSSTFVAADYELRPLNGVRNGLPGWPYWQIGAVGVSRRFHWTRNASVKVTAQWGWAAVPDPVKEACFLLGADTYQLKNSRLGIAGSDGFGTIVRVRESVVAQAKLKHYCRQRVFCA